VTRSELRPAAALKPERSKEFEAGMDFGFFKDRADASVTWYNKKSADVICCSRSTRPSAFPRGRERRFDPESRMGGVAQRASGAGGRLRLGDWAAMGPEP